MSKFLENKTISSLGGGKLYTGVCNVKVVGVNPTKKELSEILGRETENEPVYTNKDAQGVPTMRVDFWLKTEDSTVSGEKVDNILKMPIYLDSVDMTNKNGDKNKYLNNKLQSTYATSVTALPEWYDKTTARVAKKGEEELLSFLSTLARLDKREEGFSVSFENYDAILKGDVSEIRSIVEGTKDNTVRVLIGINHDEGRGKDYQRVYTNSFLYGGTGSTDYMEKMATAEYGGCTYNYQDSMELQVYTPETVEEKATDDLPF